MLPLRCGKGSDEGQAGIRFDKIRKRKVRGRSPDRRTNLVNGKNPKYVKEENP
jgi:hypothetical protein